MAYQRKLLGELLIERNIISTEQRDRALIEQKKRYALFGEVLIRLGYVPNQHSFFPVLSEQLGVEYCVISNHDIPVDIINKLPAKMANHYHVMPLKIEQGALCIAMSHPLDVQMLDDLEMISKCPVKAVLGTDKDIDDAIRQYYGVGAETIEHMMTTSSSMSRRQEKVERIDEIGSEASIGQFLNQLILEAYRDRATDIHIEPFETTLIIRYRIDGVLYDAQVPSDIVHFRDALISRIKVLANLDIAEKRLPQDGRIKVRVDDVDLDLRIAFLPTQYGQGVVIRLLSSLKLLNIAELGLPPSYLQQIRTLIHRPHGIIFVTGPTGSGKTTTLYACLSELNQVRRKLVTIEDPVEYQLKGITQVNVSSQIGLTFAKGLRSILRFDPDVMMVGEVRDLETAQITIQAALTGHLVFSTVHTNDAASGVARLIDMGVEPFLVASSVQCFIAQRLVRKVCPHCKQSVIPEQSSLDRFNVKFQSDMTFYESVGCDDCRMTGYMGREAVYELLFINEDIRQLILNRAPASQIMIQAKKNGMRTLLDHAFQKAASGVTTLEEVFRLAIDQE